MARLSIVVFVALLVLVVAGCKPQPAANPPEPGPTTAPPAAPAPAGTEALLERIRAERRDLHFARPKPSRFPWYTEQGGELTADGHEINAPFFVGQDYTGLNQAMQALGEFLMGQGFSRDPYNSTEIVDGFINGNTVTAIRSTCPDEGAECTLTIRMGIIKP